MQSAINEDSTQGYSSVSYGVSVEAIAIAFLVGIILLTRVLSLGSVPLSEHETQNALAAWHTVSPDASGSDLVSNSPILFWVQTIAFSVLGANEFSARILTAIAGAALCLAPLLFRDMIGHARAYIIAVLLTFSPVMMAASRLSSGMTWAVLFAILALWLFMRYQQQSQSFYAVGSITAFMAMMFLTDPGGILLGFILIGAGISAAILTAYDVSDDEAIPGHDYARGIWEQIPQFPWLHGIGFASVVIVIISTGMLLYPAGLSNVTELIGDFLTALTQRQQDTPLFFSLLTSLFYDLWLWVLAIAAVVVIVKRMEVDFTTRFLASWLVLAVIVSITYLGGLASHALWFVVPLVALASYLFDDALRETNQPTLWLNAIVDHDDSQTNILYWGKWLLAFLMFVLLIMASLHFQIIARGFTDVPNGSLTEISSRLSEAAFAKVARSIIWFIISLMFIGVGYFLAASIWGGLTTVRGAQIGILGFLMLTGLSTGWNISVDNADDPRELWHTHAVSTDVKLLRESLHELAMRHTGGFPLIPIAVVAEDDGVVAWQLRDFSNAYFLQSVSQAMTEQIVIAPANNEEPNLGGSYVGQSFMIYQTWSSNTLLGFDLLGWWADRRSRVQPYPAQQIILWVRQDIFDGTEFQNLPGVG